jgi:hypothetical protein
LNGNLRSNGNFALTLLSFGVVLFTPLATSGAMITVPPDLSVGDKYRLVFVTSAGRDATSSNINDYNAFVTVAATSVPELTALGSSWTAIASTPSIAAFDNTDTNPYQKTGAPIYRLDGIRIADGNADFWDRSLSAPININELGEITEGFVWTGTREDGTAFNIFELGGIYNGTAIRGDSMSYNSPWWIDYGNWTAANAYPLYGISAELTVVPEPSAMILMGAGVAALVGLHLLRRHQGSR